MGELTDKYLKNIIDKWTKLEFMDNNSETMANVFEFVAMELISCDENKYGCRAKYDTLIFPVVRGIFYEHNDNDLIRLKNKVLDVLIKFDLFFNQNYELICQKNDSNIDYEAILLNKFVNDFKLNEFFEK